MIVLSALHNLGGRWGEDMQGSNLAMVRCCEGIEALSGKV